ncbi:hypothetical protein [Terrarubrum flagellatum]|uniref:hypothetical protein n=1 Tax=Terrirubrum flagellatum TaxID=2895980 RepID=UPI0031450217
MATQAIISYVKSPSSIIAVFSGACMYLAYAIAHGQWTNPFLISVCLFISIFIPKYSIISNKLEEKVNLRFAIVTLGRFARFAMQAAMNLAIWMLFSVGHVTPGDGLNALGGVFGVAMLTTLASVGAQFIAQFLFNRGYGDLNRNVMIALCLNIILTASATIGVPLLSELFKIVSLGLGGLLFAIGVMSDLRGRMAPKGGIGVFFGTFNPFHVTHLALIRGAIETRGLSKVIVHPTVTPKLHALALERGEIRVARIEAGLCVLEKTTRADANVNYFPTGNRFFPPETRKLMIELSLAEAGLADKVEVMWLPEIYRDKGFHGVLHAIRKAHPGERIHGLHGSDLGGMWVRAIYDECGWIYPIPRRRTDKVSATAIRNGAVNMTSGIVTDILAHLKAGEGLFESGPLRFRNEAGLVSRA